jgi:hypothetical protein
VRAGVACKSCANGYFKQGAAGQQVCQKCDPEQRATMCAFALLPSRHHALFEEQALQDERHRGLYRRFQLLCLLSTIRLGTRPLGRRERAYSFHSAKSCGFMLASAPSLCTAPSPRAGRSADIIGGSELQTECHTRWSFQFFYGLSGFNNVDTQPQYITDFFFYIGIASLSTDFTQAGCPDAPPGDFASKYYAQVPGRCSGAFGNFRT